MDPYLSLRIQILSLLQKNPLLGILSRDKVMDQISTMDHPELNSLLGLLIQEEKILSQKLNSKPRKAKRLIQKIGKTIRNTKEEASQKEEASNLVQLEKSLSQ